MVWCYCSICGESEKVVSTQTERLHRQEEFGRIDHFIDNSQEETREPLLSTSQSFNLSISSAEDLTTSFLACNIEQRIEQEGENEEVEHEAEEIDNKEIERIKKFKLVLNYSSSEEDSETETKQENDFEDSLFIRDTGLLDDIELEDSDIEEETILSFKNTKTYTQPNSKYILYSILSNTFKDSFNLTIQWAGQSFATIKYPARRMYYGALILVSCDTPARNKICGFSSHSSKHACFKYQSNIDNYSLRNIEEHKIIAEKWKYSISSEHKQLFDQYGIQWSSFLQLSYFDPITFSVFDSMHNIFLGTACKIMKIWTIETELISKNQLINIQNIVNNGPPPASIGRISHKIASSFSGFTSD
ncbi:15468_t:CDS:2 [Dentiscutata erythropus]|uniref:15468_t:CDS:1 n=1 Tax=Dentiscutata erythropus TaxID=1348616 RepID=A0A9N9CT78_9GLOM|nr:15468_t:CDS:2 [Dentiscutata erythropus]